MAFLAWSAVGGRSADISRALGGQSLCVYPRSLRGEALVPLRYGFSAVASAAYLLRKRPRSVIATAPPVFPGLIALLYGWAWHVPVVLDSHPGAFGLMGDRHSARLGSIHRWLLRRARSTLVTTPELASVVDSAGGSPVIVHEAPPPWDPSPGEPLRGRPQVLFVGTFGGDEPADQVVSAARLVPEMDIRVTGDVQKCPPGLLDSPPPNVTFVGYLGLDSYRAALERSHLVMALSTESNSVMRAAYEAVYTRRPVVVSDWPALRELFPHAVHVDNDAHSIAAGLRAAVARHAELLVAAPAAHRLQADRWDDQLRRLRDVLCLASADAAALAGSQP